MGEPQHCRLLILERRVMFALFPVYDNERRIERLARSGRRDSNSQPTCSSRSVTRLATKRRHVPTSRRHSLSVLGRQFVLISR